MSVVAGLERRQSMCVVLESVVQGTVACLVHRQGVVGRTFGQDTTARFCRRRIGFRQNPDKSPNFGFSCRGQGKSRRSVGKCRRSRETARQTQTFHRGCADFAFCRHFVRLVGWCTGRIRCRHRQGVVGFQRTRHGRSNGRDFHGIRRGVRNPLCRIVSLVDLVIWQS